MKKALDERALKYACQRVEDFALVNVQRESNEKLESVDIWLEHLGLDEPLRKEFALWLDRFIPGWNGSVMIGFAVGLLINQYNLENS